MSSIEQFVRQTQLPAVEKPRQKLLVPARVGSARTAKGGPAAAQPVGQTPFKDVYSNSESSTVTQPETPPSDAAQVNVSLPSSGRSVVTITLSKPWTDIKLGVTGGYGGTSVYDLFLLMPYSATLPNTNGGTGTAGVAQFLFEHGGYSVRSVRDDRSGSAGVNMAGFAAAYGYEYSPNRVPNPAFSFHFPDIDPAPDLLRQRKLYVQYDHATDHWWVMYDEQFTASQLIEPHPYSFP